MERLQAIMNTRFRLLKNQKGLTLVELLAVIVILGVISAIAVPAIGGVIKSSKSNADTQTEILIKDAAYQYLTNTNADTSLTSVTVPTLVSAGYLREAPLKQSATTTTPYATVTVSYSASGWSVTAVSP
jgi:type IV pilus assembly protein PilA